MNGLPRRIFAEANANRLWRGVRLRSASFAWTENA
jgi:hypothetical protein